jgi:hypothetical protein
MLDAVALKTDPAMLPRAAAVIATEEETVEGAAHRKKKPRRNGSATWPANARYSPNPSSGNRMNTHP